MALSESTTTQPDAPSSSSHHRRHHFHILEENARCPIRSACFPREQVANPLILACHNDDFEMIQLLLEYGFVVWDLERLVDEAVLNRIEQRGHPSSFNVDEGIPPEKKVYLHLRHNLIN